MSAPEPTAEPTLYLHVGTHKTGTSSLQAALYAHRDALADAGLLYPTDGIYATPVGWSGPPPEGGHRYLAFAMMGTHPPWDARDYTSPFEDCRDALRADLATWRRGASGRGAGRRDALLSSEHWFREVAPEALRALVDGIGFRLRVVAYLRRQDAFLESLYDQRVRGAVTVDPFDAFVERCLADPRSYPWYHHRLAAFADVFGDDAVVVRPFEAAQLVGGDVVGDLLSVVGCAPAVWRRPARHNPSLPTELAECVRALVAALPPDVPHRERLRLSHHLRLGAAPPGADPRRYARLAPADRRVLVDRFADDNARVARRFLGRADGRLFSAPLDDGAPVWPGLSVEALARAGLFAWARCADERRPPMPSLEVLEPDAG